MMTEKELLIYFADDFHDWIDGDDPVEECRLLEGNQIWVKFESGNEFMITVSQV